MAKIVPSILTSDVNEAQRQLDRLADLVEWVQIDFMDGQFVEAVSISPEDISQLKTDLSLEAHLMVSQPHKWIEFLDERFKIVYFHIEAVADPTDLIKEIRDQGFDVGAAVKIETPITAIEPFVELIDNVLFMSVVPGRQGQSFHPEVLEKIREFINQFPDHCIAIDGGVNETNIIDVAAAGVDDIGVGSAVSKHASAELALNKLKDKLR